MTYLGRLWRIELSALAALAICAGAMAFCSLVAGTGAPAQGNAPLPSPQDFAKAYFVYTLMFGVLPVVLFGAPLYALASETNKASWWLAAIIGVTPGIGVLFLEPWPRF